MWRQLSLIGMACLLSFYSAGAHAAGLAFSRNARTYELQHSTLVTKGLANACLSMVSIPDGLLCNPAFGPLNKKATLGAALQLSNGYSTLQSLRSLLDGNLNQELTNTLFSQGRVIQIEANADIFFQSKYLSGLFSPMSIKGFSVVRNEANPDIDLYAIEEKALTFQSGYALNQNFLIGIQLRSVERKFIKQRFKLVALGTPAGQDLVKPKEQSAVYIEPALTYIGSHDWRPRVSVMAVNLGVVNKKYDELPEPAEVQYGLGVSPPIGWGELDLSLEYRSMSYEETDLKKLRFGILYNFGSMYLSGGLDSNGVSSGVYYALEKINAGIVYSSTQIANQGASFYTQTVYVQLGWQL